MGKNKQALALAEHLHSCLESYPDTKTLDARHNNANSSSATNGLEYDTNRSERNHQHRYIALVFTELGRAEVAAKIMQGLVEQSPELAALHREHAYALGNCGELDKAEQALQKALLLQPQNATTQAHLARLYCNTGRAQAGYNAFSRAATLEPNNPEYLARLIYWSNYLSTTTQQSNYQLTRLWAALAHPSCNDGNAIKRNTDPNRQVRLGMVSADFCAHASSFFIKPLLRGLDRKDFSIVAYNMAQKDDAVTAQMKELCDRWYDVSKLDDTALRKLVQDDKIDILFDLNGHAKGNRLGLFAQRNAPIQISWLGYPGTTGLKSMDFRITDRVADPVGMHDEFYSESLLRLPNGFLCYEPLATAPEPQTSNNNGAVRFGAFVSLAKVSDITLDCWAAALHAVPDSTLYLKHQQLVSEATREHFIRKLADRGVNESRIRTKTSTPTIEEHFAEYNHVDIALDTSPYNARTSTMEALWMGVPVITLLGQTHAGRATASILQRLELEHLATESVQRFGDCAQALAEDREKLNALKVGLRSRLQNSSLLDQKRFGRDLGIVLRSEWRHWCQLRTTAAPSATSKEATS